MRILFVSQDSSGRCQMAAALAQELYGPDAECLAAAAEPSSLHPLAQEAAQTRHLDLRRFPAQPLSSVDVKDLDLVVVVSERDVTGNLIPRNVKRVHWPIMNPVVPPAPTAELKQRFRELEMQLSKHLKGLGRIRKQLSRAG